MIATAVVFVAGPVLGSIGMWLGVQQSLPSTQIGTSVPEQNVKAGTQGIKKNDFYMPEIQVVDSPDTKRTMNFATQVKDGDEKEMFDFPMGTN